MSLSMGVLIWIVSFLIFLGILILSYKVSYKLGIKKALYRTKLEEASMWAVKAIAEEKEIQA